MKKLFLYALMLCCLVVASSQTAKASLATESTYNWNPEPNYLLDPGQQLSFLFDINKEFTQGSITSAELTLTFTATSMPGLRAVATIADRDYQTFLATKEGLLGAAVFFDATKQDVYINSKYLLDGVNDDGLLHVFVFADTSVFGMPTAALTVDNATLTVTGTPTPTPVPAAAWLLGSGLIGLMGVKSRGRAAIS